MKKGIDVLCGSSDKKFQKRDQAADEVKVGESHIPGQRKFRKHFDPDGSKCSQFKTLADFWRKQDFEVSDLITTVCFGRLPQYRHYNQFF